MDNDANCSYKLIMPGIGPYVWGEAKHTSNLKKHGVDFAIDEHFDLDTVVVFRDHRRDYGEERLVAFGLIRGRLRVLVFTRRGSLYRGDFIAEGKCKGDIELCQKQKRAPYLIRTIQNGRQRILRVLALLVKWCRNL